MAEKIENRFMSLMKINNQIIMEVFISYFISLLTTADETNWQEEKVHNFEGNLFFYKRLRMGNVCLLKKEGNLPSNSREVKSPPSPSPPPQASSLFQTFSLLELLQS